MCDQISRGKYRLTFVFCSGQTGEKVFENWSIRICNWIWATHSEIRVSHANVKRNKQFNWCEFALWKYWKNAEKYSNAFMKDRSLWKNIPTCGRKGIDHMCVVIVQSTNKHTMQCTNVQCLQR